MIVLFTGDWHLGVKSHGKIVDGMNSREIELRDCISFMVDKAINEHGVDMFVITGDIFHTNNPSNDSIDFFLGTINRLIEAGLMVRIITGNHDCMTIAARVSPVDIAKHFMSDNLDLEVVTDKPMHELIGMNDPWQLCYCPYGTPLSEAVKGYKIDCVSDKKILVGHTELQGCVVGAESQMLSRYCECEPIPEEIDVLICGHIHKPQILRNDDKFVAYHGSLIQTSSGERGEKKGYLVIDLATGDKAFHRVPHRRLFRLM